MRYKTFAPVSCFIAGSVVGAQRPDDESICDYYAVQRYGSNTSTTQYQLIESIVGLAYVGGSDISSAPDNSTGIFNNATFDGSPVYLRPWFDGSEETTNLNDEAVGVNWLDGGGLDPIVAFLNGSEGSVELQNGTNQYRLFNHWYSAFGHIYGCTLVEEFPSKSESGESVDMAYTHKFMNLNSSDVAYFIDQFTVASQYYGFSEQDAQTLDLSMNAKYNVRCSPAVNGELYSICLAPECPLYEPSPDCAAYSDIQPMASATTTSSASATATSSVSTGSTSSSGSGPLLNGGDIAGIAVGGAAVILIAIGLWLYYRRHKAHLVPVPVQAGGQLSPAGPYTWSPNPHTSTVPSSIGIHDSYISGVTSVVGAPPGSPGFWTEHKPPQEMSDTGVDRHYAQGRRTPETYQIAEMESPDLRQSNR